MKFFVIVFYVLLCTVCTGCSLLFSPGSFGSPGSPGEQTEKKYQAVNVFNSYLKKVAPGSYCTTDVYANMNRCVGVCIYINERNYPALKEFFGLPDYTIKGSIMNNPKFLEGVTDSVLGTMDNQMYKLIRSREGVMVVIGDVKNGNYYLSQYEYRPYYTRKEFKGGLDAFDEVECKEWRLQCIRREAHTGYEFSTGRYVF